MAPSKKGAPGRVWKRAPVTETKLTAIKQLIRKRQFEETQLENEVKAEWEEKKKMEDAKKEDANESKELTLEECQQEIKRIEDKLDALQEQKHRYFKKLKMVLKEDEKQKEAERIKQEEERRAQDLQEAQQQEAAKQEASPAAQPDGFRAPSMTMLLSSSSSLLRHTPGLPGLSNNVAASMPNASPSFPQASFFGSPGAPFVGSPGNIGSAPLSGYDQRNQQSAMALHGHGAPLAPPRGFMGGQYHPQQGVVHFRPPAQIMPHPIMGISRAPFNAPRAGGPLGTVQLASMQPRFGIHNTSNPARWNML